MNERRESIRLTDWLAARIPRPPDELSSALILAVGDTACTESDIAPALIANAKQLLSTVGTDRAAALDLLAADALITYAMEAAAESGSVEAVASDAMQQIAGVVE